MKFSVIIVGLIALLVLVGIYFYFFKPQILTPPLLTPPKAPPSLNVYGKLIDYSQNELMSFKIQSEIVNWELNNTLLEIQAKPELFFNFTDDYLRCIDQKWYPTEAECKNHFYQQYNLSQKCENMIELPEKGLLYVKCEVKLDLIIGNNYVFYFSKRFDEKGPWDSVAVSENLTKYKEDGMWKHENDLAIDQMTITEGGEEELEPGQMRAVRIIPTAIITGETTELKILLINKQNNDIKYKIKDAKIVNEQASQWYGYWWQLPPYEERLRNAIINECSVSFDSSETIILANSTKLLTFTVNCPKDVDITKSYEICDNYEEKRNCRMEVANRTDNLMLWGEIEFVDELDNKHIFPEKGVLKQSLEIAQKASVSVDYSREISSKDEFYIYVDYKDTTGNQIKDAQIELQFKNLGVSGIFTLRYDESLNKYKFRWSNFVEWDPGYKKGTYSFTITAHKISYPTIQSGPYYFTLK